MSMHKVQDAKQNHLVPVLVTLTVQRPDQTLKAVLVK